MDCEVDAKQDSIEVWRVSYFGAFDDCCAVRLIRALAAGLESVS